MNVKTVKPLLIAIPLNLLVGLAYCMIAKKMALVSYSNALLIIGGAYAAIGAFGFMGGMDSEARSTMTWKRDYSRKMADENQRSSFNIAAFIIGIITILMSLAVTAFL